MSALGIEEPLREIAERRYHHRHRFNIRMHEGVLTREELRGWILNRFCYQRHIPIKDALILAKLESPKHRRMWVRRLHDHDGTDEDEGGIERWLRLGEAAGLDRAELWSGTGVLPGVRLAVEGYVNFCRLRGPLEAVASSLTEVVAPDLMATRIAAFEKHYTWIDSEGLRYFQRRVDQGRRDGREALELVEQWVRTPEDRSRVLAAFEFKCDVLWALLDAVEHAYRPESRQADVG
ncbi:pyrroloquinoline-quinone synthase PqqC [Actinomadura fulvescens]|uniref:Pyrroloquinoline-quinone synthase n=1 Tax=Actinomadura fulvescens TaxID=46160 RepID=A0ABN3QU99_9ACTN